MSSVNSVCHNLMPMSDNNKKNVLLYGDPRIYENKNKCI